jgi:hypothetical protein
MSEINFFDLQEPDGGFPPNPQVKASVFAVAGTGPTQLGMFDISVAPVSPSDQLINVQFIVQYAGEPPSQFTGFILLGDPPAGGGFTATMFAGNDSVAKNQQGAPLTVSLVGGVNQSTDPFFFPFPFPGNLWH